MCGIDNSMNIKKGLKIIRDNLINMKNLLEKIGLGFLYTVMGVIAYLLPVYISITYFLDGDIITGIWWLIIGIPLAAMATPLIILLLFICTLYWLVGDLILGNDISILGIFAVIWNFIFGKLLISLFLIGVLALVFTPLFLWLSKKKERRQTKEVINAEYESIDE